VLEASILMDRQLDAMGRQDEGESEDVCVCGGGGGSVQRVTQNTVRV